MNLRKDHYHTFKLFESRIQQLTHSKGEYWIVCKHYSVLDFCVPSTNRIYCNTFVLYVKTPTFFVTCQRYTLTGYKHTSRIFISPKQPMKKHFQQWMSWLPHRWRTQWNAIRHANCKISESSKLWTHLALPLRGVCLLECLFIPTIPSTSIVRGPRMQPTA